MKESVKIHHIDSRVELGSELGQMLMSLCQAADNEDSVTARNLQTINWAERSETLLYCIYIEKRFDSPEGKLFALTEDGEMVSVGGIYRTEFCPESIAVGAVRTYTHPKKRNQFWHGQYLIPAQIAWATEQKISQIIFSVNAENSRLFNFLKRATEQKASVLGRALPDIYKKLELHPRPIKLKNTVQQIFKLNIDSNFKWDYSSLEVEA